MNGSDSSKALKIVVLLSEDVGKKEMQSASASLHRAYGARYADERFDW